MKKIVLSAVVALAGFVGLNAQSMESLQLGVRGGYNSTIMSQNVQNGYESARKSGYYVGLFTEVPMGNSLTLQPEVNYSEQKAKTVGKSGDKGFAELKWSGLQIPVLVKYYMADGFNILAGPQLDIPLHAKLEQNWKGKNPSVDNEFKKYLNDIVFGLTFGAAYKTPVGVVIDARYNLGMTPILEEKLRKDPNKIFKLKPREFTVGLAYQF